MRQALRITPVLREFRSADFFLVLAAWAGETIGQKRKNATEKAILTPERLIWFNITKPRSLNLQHRGSKT